MSTDWQGIRRTAAATVAALIAAAALTASPAAAAKTCGQTKYGDRVQADSERYKYLCFRLYSPRFGYTKAVRSRT